MIKSQLACTVTMLATNIVYIILFLIIFSLTRITYKPMTPSFQPLQSSQTSTPKPILHALHSTAPYPYQQPSIYPPPQYEQTVYPGQHVTWRSPVYFNGTHKF